MPVHEITPKTPLGSHLPFPMNVNAPQDSPPRQKLSRQPPDSPESPSKPTRRRATLPSLVLSQTDLSALSSMWEQEAQDTVADVVRKGTPTPNIGMAITSTSAQSSNRRSRSADDLAEVAKAQAQYERQTGVQKRASSRAAEIEYWRASFTPVGMSSVDSEPTTETPVDPPEARHPHEISTMTPELSTEPISDERRSLEQAAAMNQLQSNDRRDNNVSKEDLTSERPARTREAFRLSRDQTRNFSRPGPSEGGEDPESWEDRLSKLEYSMKKLQNTHHRSTIILDNAPRGRRNGSGSPNASNSRSPETQSKTTGVRMHERSPESLSVDGSPTKTHGSSPRTPKLPPNATSYAWAQPQTTSPPDINASSVGSKGPQPFYNPTGAPPIDSVDFAPAPRPQTSHAVPSSLPSPNMYDHLAPLYAALRYERSKRKEFEVQMTEMRQQLDELTQFVQSQYESRKANGYGSNPSHERIGYPTPSPEEIFSGSFSGDEHATVYLQPPSRFSGLDFDSESAYSDTHTGIDEKSRNVHGGYDETDDENSPGEKEVYGTPKEEFTMALPPEPSVPQLPSQSRIPTPKQSMKNIRPSTAGKEVKGQPSQGSLSNGMKNRFGFSGGKS